MIVKVKIYFSLSRYLEESGYPFKRDKLNVPESATVATVLETLKLPDEKVGIFLVNGHNSGKETVLKEGDTLSLFPPMMAGG